MRGEDVDMTDEEGEEAKRQMEALEKKIKSVSKKDAP